MSSTSASIIGSITFGSRLWRATTPSSLSVEPSAASAGRAYSGGKRGDKEMKEIPIPADKTYRWRVEEEFIGAIRGQEQVRRTSFVDAVNYMDFTEAVHISSREGRRVHLPLA